MLIENETKRKKNLPDYPSNFECRQRCFCFISIEMIVSKLFYSNVHGWRYSFDLFSNSRSQTPKHKSILQSVTMRKWMHISFVILFLLSKSLKLWSTAFSHHRVVSIEEFRLMQVVFQKNTGCILTHKCYAINICFQF